MAVPLQSHEGAEDPSLGALRGDASKFTVNATGVDYCDSRRKRRERMTQHHYNLIEGHVRHYICPDPERPKGKKRPLRLNEFKEGIGGIRLSQLTARSVGDLRDRLRPGWTLTRWKRTSANHRILARLVVADHLTNKRPGRTRPNTESSTEPQTAVVAGTFRSLTCLTIIYQ